MCCNATGESFSSERGATLPDLSPNDECAWTAVARFGWVLGRLDLPQSLSLFLSPPSARKRRGEGGGKDQGRAPSEQRPKKCSSSLPPLDVEEGALRGAKESKQKPEKSRKPVGFGPSGPSLVSSTGDAEKTASCCVRGPKGSSLIHRTSEGRRWLLRIGRWP